MGANPVVHHLNATERTPTMPLHVACTNVFPEFKAALSAAAGCTDVTLSVLPNQCVQIFGMFHDPVSRDTDQIELSSFKLHTMPGCSAILVSSRVRVTVPWRGKGLGKLLNQFRARVAREMGCSTLQCTTVQSNERQNTLLRKLGWKQIDDFLNPRTENTVLIWTRTVE